MVHDPVMAQEDGRYYLFCTGHGISCMWSDDLEMWHAMKPCLPELPSWIVDEIPQATPHLWAPDIIYHQGQWHLFYACSLFATNISVIGHATSPTLNPDAANYGWVDRGMILRSVPGRDEWNAIDPNIIIDDDGTPWMDFGSFWNGMKLVRLTDDLNAVAKPEEWSTIARRKQNGEIDITQPGDDAIEAPFIFRKGEWYYLFVSFDYCCRGKDSDYKTVVGRADNVKGPYVDRDGRLLNAGGGTLLIEGDGQNTVGVGHCAVYTFGDKDIFAAHAYDAKDGSPHLLLRRVEWTDDQWPMLKEMK